MLQQQRRGELRSALAGTDSALRAFPDPATDWHWRFTALKAEILVWQGDARGSLQLLGGALPASLAGSDTAVWCKLTEAAARTDLQEFAAAGQRLAEADAIARASHPELLGYVFLRQGTLADYQGSAAQASALYKSALESARDYKDAYLESSALGSLALASTEQEHYGESIDWNREALEVAQRSGAKSLAAKIQINTGWNLFAIGDYERALSMFQDAVASTAAADLVSDQVRCRINLGAVYAYLRDYPAAEREGTLGLNLARKMDDKTLVLQSLNTLSTVALVEGKISLASRQNQEALQVAESLGEHAEKLSALLIAGRLAMARHQAQTAEGLFDQVIHDPSPVTALTWEAEARLASLFAEEKQFDKAEAEYRESIGTIEVASRSLERDELRLPFLSSAIEFYQDYVNYLIERGKPDEALQVAELSRARTLEESLSSSQKDVPAWRRSRPELLARRLHADLLFYWLGEKKSYLWLISPTEITLVPLPRAAEIEALVKSYRKAQAENRDVLNADSSDGRKLYEMLVEPVCQRLRPHSRVVTLPDGALYSINFETLIVPGGHPHFWIEDVTLSTANSLELLAGAASKPRPKGKSLLLVGDALQASPDFPRLRQAGKEMTLVERHFARPQCAVISGEKATPSAYLTSHPERYAYLHFVTHGTASRIRPLESAIALSPEGESYKLYARDIVKHHLNAQLVTISACDGSGSRAYSGEGLVGLSWAFLRAGAHNVIGALWEVSDTATPLLMDKLYSGLAAGEDPATALRNAKLAFLHSGNVYAKPFYWAPFELYSGS